MATFTVFGDIHGRISLMLLLSRLVELRTGRKLDGVLQVGDFGAFPRVDRLDASTEKFAREDPDELGFSEYLSGCEEGSALLASCDWSVAWCRGNHEDFEYLDRYRAPEAVDRWEKLIFVPDGTSLVLAGLRVGALGGMAPRREERGRGKKARKAFRRATLRTDPRCFTEGQAEKAFPAEALDVLLTHAAPETEVTPWGSKHLAALAERVRPRVHLFGHHHVAVDPREGPGGAMLVGLDHVEFHRGHLREKCWGLLELAEGEAPRFSWGEALGLPEVITRESYRSLIPRVSDGFE